VPISRLEAVFNPRAVVVLGPDREDAAAVEGVLASLARTPFKGEVSVVGPGDRPDERLSALEVVPDVAVIVSRADRVPDLLLRVSERGIPGAIVLSQGFSNCGESGRALQDELRRFARSHALRFLGPESLGVTHSSTGFNATVGEAGVQRGRLALVSQSGALCSAILDWAGTRSLGFSNVISTGLALDIDFGDALDYLVRDPDTDSVMLYVEGIEDARHFMSALRAAARAKPVVVMKAGRHAEGGAAEAFHADSLIGSDDVFDAALRRAGVLRIRDYADFFAAAATLASNVRVKGRRLAIVTNAGGPGAMAADHARDRRLELQALAIEPPAALRAQSVDGQALDNPLVLRAEATAEEFGTAVQACLDRRSVDAVLAIFVPHAATAAEEIAERLCALVRERRRPQFTCWMGGESVAAGRARFAAERVATYATPETAVDAIAGLANFSANQQLLLQVPEPLAISKFLDVDGARLVIDGALAEGRSWLNPAESKAVLAAFNIPIVRSIPAHSEIEAVMIAQEIGYPVAMKILSPDIAHKTDVGGVRLGLANGRAVRDAYASMLEDVARARPDAQLEGVLIEPMYQDRYGRELMIGVVRDEVFGPAICFGLGGTLVEVIQDRAVALPPLNRFLARDLISRTRAGEALKPLRGAPAADSAAVEDLLLRVSELVCELPELDALDLNPVIATPSGAIVVDARLGVRRADANARPYVHMAIHPYPSAMIRSLELADGTQVTIRPIRPEDAGIERDFVNGLSEQSKFLRFMYTLHQITPEMLSRFTQIDYDRELALIAVTDGPQGEKQVGVGRYTTLPDGETCEFAIVVGDDWQGKGLARRLMMGLIEAARERRLKVMEGVTLQENGRMLELARSLGFETMTDKEDPELVQMRLQL
jgi:acetyltransferase